MENIENNELIQKQSSGPNLNKKKKIVVTVIVLLLAIVAVLYAFDINPFSRQNGEIDKNPPIVSDFSEGKMSDLIPSNLPIEDGAKVVQNYQAEFPDGRSPEGTFQYISKESMANLVSIYSQYFLDNEWGIKNILSEEKSIVFITEKDLSMMNVSISKTTIEDEFSVTISSNQRQF